MGPISQNVSPWQVFPVKYNVTIQLIGLIFFVTYKCLRCHIYDTSFSSNLQMGSIIQNVSPCQAFPAKCDVTLQLTGPICKLHINLSVVSTVPGAIFTTLHFLHNLQMCSFNESVCPWQAFPAKCNVTIQLTGPVCKLHINLSVVSTVPGAIFITLHFLHNLQMGSISVSVCPW